MATPSSGAHHGGHGHEGGHGAAHHLSPAPVLVGIGALVFYMAAAFFADVSVAFLLLGLIPLLLAFLVWIREDVQYYREGRVDEGVAPGRDLGWWGMVFFLGTEVMLFGGLFAVYFTLRGENPDVWAGAQDVVRHAMTLVVINTVILVSSSVTLEFGIKALRRNERNKFIGWLVTTLVLGAIFLGLQVREYLNLIHEGVTLSSGPFGTIFYQITGTHGVHVFLGLVFLTIVLIRALLGQFDAERHVAPEAFSLYWHFVDVVWIVVFTVIYVGTAFPGVI